MICTIKDDAADGGADSRLKQGRQPQGTYARTNHNRCKAVGSHENGIAQRKRLPQADVDKKAATVVPSKDTPVYVYCRGGREATMATEKLLKQGYTDVHNLGAMKDARERLGLPLAK